MILKLSVRLLITSRVSLVCFLFCILWRFRSFDVIFLVYEFKSEPITPQLSLKRDHKTIMRY